MNLKEILEYKLLEVGDFNVTIYKLVMILVIFIVVKLVLWSIKKGLARRRALKKLDRGTEFSLFQIIRYLVWVIAFGLGLETLGLKVTILLAGSAALLVGLGLGLQQTFNDIISGIILLVEGSTKVGDVLQVDGEVVKMKEIGLRASKAINRDDIMIIIPNSHFVNNKVINWSHQIGLTRFRIKVGVAYGSDLDLVIRLLEESADNHPISSKTQAPDARFINFGDSALEFELLFWSTEMFKIEKAISEIRLTIDRKFRENQVTIPFPQRDLHIKSGKI